MDTFSRGTIIGEEEEVLATAKNYGTPEEPVTADDLDRFHYKPETCVSEIRSRIEKLLESSDEVKRYFESLRFLDGCLIEDDDIFPC